MLSLPRLVLAAAGFTLASCSLTHGSSDRVAAKVNRTAITIPQFRWLFERAKEQFGPKADPEAVMDGIVDRELMAQKALQFKLDRDPPVALALDEARTQILAQAYLESRISTDVAALPEADQFYLDHPELFAHRRVYQVFELAVVASPDRVAALKARVSHARDLSQVADWLRSQDLPFNIAGASRGSEQLAIRLRERLDQMKEGELAVLDSAGGASVIQLVQSQPAPISREAAEPAIERILLARKQAEIAVAESKALRGKAYIEYDLTFGTLEPKVSRPPEPQQAEPLQVAVPPMI